MNAISSRQGGRYIRDEGSGAVIRDLEPGRQDGRAGPATDALDPGSRDAALPHAVQDDDRGLIAALAKANVSREGSPVPTAPQARLRAGADAPPASDGSAKRETPVRRKD